MQQAILGISAATYKLTEPNCSSLLSKPILSKTILKKSTTLCLVRAPTGSLPSGIGCLGLDDDQKLVVGSEEVALSGFKSFAIFRPGKTE